MKTAISLPTRVFREAERYAQRTGKSRSQLYTEAVAEYIARRSPDAVTEAMNEVCDRLGQPDSGFTLAAARQTLEGWRSCSWE